MNDDFDEEERRIIEESKKLLCRPWKEVVPEIVTRQTLGRRPLQTGTYPPPPLTPSVSPDEKDLPPPRPPI